MIREQTFETKSQTVDRLRGWGVWKFAQRLKELERERLRAEGVPRREAVERSWLHIQRLFPECDLQEVGIVWDEDLPE